MGVATAVAIGGLALQAGSTINSFAQAGEQKNKQRQAEAAAKAAMEEARKKLEINFTDELAINKEPYELQREAMLSAGAQAIQAGVESERGAVATAGKVLMAQNEAQAGIRTAMGAEMTDIQKQQIAEESRLRDLKVQLDLGEVEGQQMIAANAEEAAEAQTQQGIQGAMSLGMQGLNMIDLFPKTKLPDTTVATNTTPAPTNPLPGTAESYGPAGINWSGPAPLFAKAPSYANPLPGTAASYGPAGPNWSGVGYNN